MEGMTIHLVMVVHYCPAIWLSKLKLPFPLFKLATSTPSPFKGFEIPFTKLQQNHKVQTRLTSSSKLTLQYSQRKKWGCPPSTLSLPDLQQNRHSLISPSPLLRRSLLLMGTVLSCDLPSAQDQGTKESLQRKNMFPENKCFGIP